MLCETKKVKQAVWRVLLIFQDFCENYESVCELNYPSEVDILEMKLKQFCKSIKNILDKCDE